MNSWLTWTLPRAVVIVVALQVLGVDNWIAFATAGCMLELLRERTKAAA